LVIAAGEPAQEADLLWLAMITSAENRGWRGDVPISESKGTGLPIPSIVRPAKLATIEARDAEGLGSLPTTDRDAVSRYLKERLRAALGLSD
jgi:mRNA interferase MazF